MDVRKHPQVRWVRRDGRYVLQYMVEEWPRLGDDGPTSPLPELRWQDVPVVDPKTGTVEYPFCKEDDDPEPSPDVAHCSECEGSWPVGELETKIDGDCEGGYYRIHICPVCPGGGCIEDYSLSKERGREWAAWDKRHPAIDRREALLRRALPWLQDFHNRLYDAGRCETHETGSLIHDIRTELGETPKEVE